MKHIKKYKVFESKEDDILLIIDCYQDIFDDFNMVRRDIKDLLGYEGVLNNESNVNTPYVMIDRSKSLSVPHDSIVVSDCPSNMTDNDAERLSLLETGDYSYFIFNSSKDKKNPGCSVVIIDYSIKGGRYTNKEAEKFLAIKNPKLREAVLEAHDKVINVLGMKDSTVYSVIVDDRIDIQYYYNRYKFERSWLISNRRFMSDEKFNRLMKDAE